MLGSFVQNQKILSLAKLLTFKYKLACVRPLRMVMSFSYSLMSKFVMPDLRVLELCSSHQIIILSYARAASSSSSKQPKLVGFPFRLRNWYVPLKVIRRKSGDIYNAEAITMLHLITFTHLHIWGFPDKMRCSAGSLRDDRKSLTQAFGILSLQIPHLNCASQRFVGKVWCTPLYREV